jgi:single-strand DNA-binding protein
MANLNRVFLIGRLTADPETRSLSSGAKVTKIRFAVNNPTRNQQSGEWEDNPVFVDVDIWNSGKSTLADRAEQSLRKGMQIFIEGRLKLDQWTAQDGQKRSKLFVVASNFQFLEPRGEGSGGYSRSAAPAGSNVPAKKSNYDEPPPGGFSDGPPDGPPDLPGDSDIPF